MTARPGPAAEVPAAAVAPERSTGRGRLRDVAALVVLARTAGPADLDPRGWPSLLRVVLGRIGMDAERWELRRGRSGRPFAVDAASGRASRWTFNASHSGNLLALAVAPCGHIGLDVQQLPGAGWERIARRWLHPADVVALPSDPDAGRREFNRVWAIREACCKATGAGLAGFADMHPVGRTDTGRSGRVWWREITVPPGYAGAVARCGRGAGQLARLPVLTWAYPADWLAGPEAGRS
jgi:4'-phosphopantetheinyl transferase superfamily